MSSRATADRLHSAAIHLLRNVRASDVETGLSPARLSVLSVLVFGGARTPSELAAAEQVRLPTISALVRGLEEDGLVRRAPDPDDGRAVRLSATAKGRRILQSGRERRLDNLEELLEPLSREELRTLAEASEILERAISGRGRAPAA
ncbi:MAG TPA: MarR family transcriptional regulator [Gaiellaceae bacterium]|nr:MarR family transcriptional regulator [Gaiellaceae bacterium]